MTPHAVASPARAAVRTVLAVSLATLALWGTASPVFAGGILPANNPKANVAPVPDFLKSGQCSYKNAGWSCPNPCISNVLTFPTYSNTPQCAAYVLLAINNARKLEKVAPMVLPTNWTSLAPPQQLFVLADLERTARGLPPYLGLNAALTATAQQAALKDTDPGLAPGFAAGINPQGYYGMGGTWGSGFSTLSVDYFWMYADGWGGSAYTTSNLGCTSPTAAECWAHRDQLLGFDPKFNPGVGLYCKSCEMGTGFAVTHGYSSFVDLIELPAGAPPAMTFTWAKNVVPNMPKPVPATTKKKATSPHHAKAHRASSRSAWRHWAPHGTASTLCLAKGMTTHWGAPVCRGHHPASFGWLP